MGSILRQHAPTPPCASLARYPGFVSGTITGGLGNYSLCHGSCGNAELLMLNRTDKKLANDANHAN
jgi:hypothetical protein